ncbi:MAG: choice-of-anchor D domain-containing protein [Myxococcales bacterium]|nr:choice-of-anchor D domain-containing protein [Myxococcales bacterium]
MPTTPPPTPPTARALRAARAALALALPFALLASPACGDGGGKGPSSGAIPTIEISEGGRPVLRGGTVIASTGALEPGDTGVVAELRVINTGNAVLEIASVEIDASPPGTLSLAAADGSALPAPPYLIDPNASGGPNRSSLTLGLVLHRPPEGVRPTGTITVHSNTVIEGVEVESFVFAIDVEEGRPVMQVTPAQADMGNVSQGRTGDLPLSIVNQGTLPLVIDRFTLSGHPALGVTLGDDTWDVSAETVAGVTLPTPLTIAGGTTAIATLHFSPTTPEAASGTLTLFSNDPTLPGGKAVPISANVGGPCLEIAPSRVDFGGKLVGTSATVELTLTSCGDKPLSISEIGLAAGGSDEYTLALETLPGLDGGGAVTELTTDDAPVVLAPNATAKLRVVYVPADVSPLDAGGQPVRDTATLHLVSNSFYAERDLDVRGFGTDTPCPTAVIRVDEGEEVIPQTTLHLKGNGSVAQGGGTIAEWLWEVEQPDGSVSLLLPAATAANPTFEANVAGTYLFRLVVTDSSGLASCVPAEETVQVIPDEELHIELLWETPKDEDLTDTKGSDLDLHFTDPRADTGHDVDGDGADDAFFDEVFDCFYFHKTPNWGGADASPTLDRDDTDGAGPENINLHTPENGKTYTLGVHYFDDHDMDAAFAEVRVYIHGQLAWSDAGVELAQADMWTVGTLTWPAETLTPATVCAGTFTTCATSADCGGAACERRIAPAYRPPNFPVP